MSTVYTYVYDLRRPRTSTAMYLLLGRPVLDTEQERVQMRQVSTRSALAIGPHILECREEGRGQGQHSRSHYKE